MFSFTYFATDPLFANLGMQVTNRVLIVTGGLIMCVSHIVSGFAESVGVLVVFYGVFIGQYNMKIYKESLRAYSWTVKTPAVCMPRCITDQWDLQYIFIIWILIVVSPK